MSRADALRYGQNVDGRYTLETAQRGPGLGHVWLASDDKFPGRKVTIKFLDPPRELDEDAFLARMKSIRALRHPNAVAVVNQGVWQGFPFIVSEPLPEESLAEWLAAQRRASIAIALGDVWTIFDAIASALQAAHGSTGAPIVHGVLQPGSVLHVLHESGRRELRVCDFGLGPFDGTVNATAPGIGEYLAPEATRAGATLTPAADVFSLGVLLVEVLTGRAAAAARWGTVGQQGGLRDGIGAVRSDLTGYVVDRIAGAFTTDPEQRYANAGAFLDAVRAVRPRASAHAVTTYAPTHSAGAKANAPPPRIAAPMTPAAAAAPPPAATPSAPKPAPPSPAPEQQPPLDDDTSEVATMSHDTEQVELPEARAQRAASQPRPSPRTPMRGPDLAQARPRADRSDRASFEQLEQFDEPLSTVPTGGPRFAAHETLDADPAPTQVVPGAVFEMAVAIAEERAKTIPPPRPSAVGIKPPAAPAAPADPAQPKPANSSVSLADRLRRWSDLPYGVQLALLSLAAASVVAGGTALVLWLAQ